MPPRHTPTARQARLGAELRKLREAAGLVSRDVAAWLGTSQAQISNIEAGKHGISEWDILDTFASLRTLKRFGVKVHKQKNLRVHAKLIIVDNAHALVGSMNIDRSAFDLRRELGIMTSDPAVAGRLKAVFDSDWELSHHYEAPDPLDPSQHHEDDFPHDHDLMHE